MTDIIEETSAANAVKTGKNKLKKSLVKQEAHYAPIIEALEERIASLEKGIAEMPAPVEGFVLRERRDSAATAIKKSDVFEEMRLAALDAFDLLHKSL